MNAPDSPTREALPLGPLRDYLEGRAAGGAGLVVKPEIVGELTATRLTGGKSNLTFLVEDEGGHRWAVRRPPMAGVTPSAHDMKREFTVMRGLGGTDVPVPDMIALCTDESVIGAQFLVSGFVDGRVIRSATDLDGLSDAQLGAAIDGMVGALSTLHATDYRDAGLGEFGRPEGYLTRQAKRWLKQWGHVKAEEIPDVERLGNALLDRVAAVEAEAPAPSVVHGDYRLDNVMLDHGDPGKVLAIVDWELSTLGDPLSDVAMMCAYRSPQLDRVLGFEAAWSARRVPSPDELAQRFATATGSTLPNWDFYLALAYFKIGVIAAGIAHRTRQGADAGDDDAGSTVPEYMSLGLAALGG